MYEVFKTLCESHNVRPADVAKATGISAQTFTAWKKGISTPKADKMQLIANYFGVPVEYLMTGEMKSHYSDSETAMIAQEIAEDNEMRLLFDAARGSSPDNLRIVREMLLALKRKAND